jgi:type I restriction enzyme M protein
MNPERSPLSPQENLRAIFAALRNYLAGNARGITRDETLAREVINLLFCKMHDEKGGEEERREGEARFVVLPGESAEETRRRIVRFFEEVVKPAYPDAISPDEHLALDAASLARVVSALQEHSLTTAERDAVGDAFEVFIGPTLRGSEGQFFTPRNVVRLLVECLDPKPGETVMDPACGSGGFLVGVLDHLCAQGIAPRDAVRQLYGIDKDLLLSRIARTHLTLLGGSGPRVFCENSLDRPENWSPQCREAVQLGAFDLVLTNPPFGAKIPVQGKELLAQYALSHRWQRGRDGRWKMTSTLHEKQPPQVLFIERCLQLAKKGGRVGIVLPEGIFGNPSDRYIWEFLFQYADVLGVISMPPETFQPSTHTKTSLLLLRKCTEIALPSSPPLFMAIAERAGHDKNGKTVYEMRGDGSLVRDAGGKPIVDDDTPTIAARFRALRSGEPSEQDHLGFLLDADELTNHVLIPEYYNPEIARHLEALEASGEYELVAVEELVRQGALSIKRGNEIGSRFYGTGDVPFVRTTDIVNWEIKMDPVKAVSQEAYEQYRRRQDVREGDILFVNDGTFLIGRTAMVTDLDTRIVLQSHIRKIRVCDGGTFDAYYLFYLLNTRIVRRQIEAKTFVQATISTLGGRLKDIVLPVHADPSRREAVAAEVRHILTARRDLRKRSLELVHQTV